MGLDIVIGQMLFDRINDMSEYTFLPSREKLVCQRANIEYIMLKKKKRGLSLTRLNGKRYKRYAARLQYVHDVYHLHFLGS